MRYLPKKKPRLLIRKTHTPVVRIPIPGLRGAFCDGTGVGRVVCTASGVVVTGRVVTGEGVGFVGGKVTRTGCGVVKISIAAGALREWTCSCTRRVSLSMDPGFSTFTEYDLSPVLTDVRNSTVACPEWSVVTRA